MEVATTGPCHSRIAGIAKPVVFPVCVGPTTIADCLDSVATSRPPARPRISRPGLLSRTSRARRSPGRAQRAAPGAAGRVLKRTAIAHAKAVTGRRMTRKVP